jgi:hypothetical protein
MIDPNVDGEMPIDPFAEPEKLLNRDEPDTTEQRKALVTSMMAMVKEAKTHWEKTFKQMEKDQRFCAGEQWPSETKASYFNDAADDRYVANITLRHVQTRVASLYAKNPKAVARRRKRLLTTVWDGQMATLQMAQQMMQMAMQAQAAQMMPPQIDPASGMPMPPPAPPDPVAIQQAQAVLEDAQQAKQQLDQMKKIADTLEILYAYEVEEQAQPFKSMMKMVIRRASTAGVGWVRIGFQRTMGKNPDFDTHLADLEQRLSMIERISADIADGETQETSAEAEQLRLNIQDLMSQEEIVLREGLQFSYPKSTAVIVDPRCVQLRDFLGCDWAAEEFCLSVNEIKEIYGVDVGKQFVSYSRQDTGTDYERARASWQRGEYADSRERPEEADSALVWEIYNKRDGMVYVVCDGYQDFLREPASPEPWIERFFPWFAVMFNETDGRVYPPSDVSLVRPMQLEMNRSRQGQREHRFASRPKIAYAEGMLSEEDLDALKNHPVNALIAISGLQAGQNIAQVLQPIEGVGFNPALYETNMIFQDLLRAVGEQAANLGGSDGATATETQVAQQSRSSALGSSVDDLDETLTCIAKAAGQILLLNVSEEVVKDIVGPGAVWPTLTKSDVAKNVWLEVEAASSGKPDQQLAVMNFERLGPLLMQIPGITPMFLAKEAIKRLDDKLDIEEALSEGAPSLVAQNGMNAAGPGQGGSPAVQGPQGAQGGGNNAPKPPTPNSQAPGVKSSQPMGGPQPMH